MSESYYDAICSNCSRANIAQFSPLDDVYHDFTHFRQQRERQRVDGTKQGDHVTRDHQVNRRHAEQRTAEIEQRCVLQTLRRPQPIDEYAHAGVQRVETFVETGLDHATRFRDVRERVAVRLRVSHQMSDVKIATKLRVGQLVAEHDGRVEQHAWQLVRLKRTANRVDRRGVGHVAGVRIGVVDTVAAIDVQRGRIETTVATGRGQSDERGRWTVAQSNL